ncbi:MAG: sigma-54-dependent Fis family transcriptional regulator [Acidobacteria bacterium]|nr:sigma-54-dependent Fis family transcriptional regulator [Acidobacteriota bacterium]
MKDSHLSAGHEVLVDVLAVDDCPSSLALLDTALAAPGICVHTCVDPAEAFDLVERIRPRIVISGLVMPRMSGIELLEKIHHFDASIDVVIMTAHYTTETAVDAIRKGAADYWNKPVPVALLRERVQHFAAEARLRAAAGGRPYEDRFHGILGQSAPMWELFGKIKRVAPHYRTALITGPTGSGKDLVARAMHGLSRVAGGRFVVLNCSAVVETLFESELFGHVRGSFTGASSDKPGLFEHAHEGTLFLDEIGDMPLSTQAKLLRVLQEQEVMRVGSLTPRKVNVHVIAATHVNLREAVAAGRFREDLYYRLSMLELEVPPLAERLDDLPLLEQFFIDKYAKQFGRDIRDLTHRARLVLAEHDWPGNVRELENVIGHACLMAAEASIDVMDLPKYLWEHAEELPPEHGSSLEEQEARSIRGALSVSKGNQSQAARMLGIGRDALRYKMKKHGMAAGR